MSFERSSTTETVNSHDFVVPYSILDTRLNEDVDTEQHKKYRGHSLHKRHIRHYRHAKTKWGAALEGFSPMWFALCISSGGLALILNGPFPYRGYWQVTIATILYVVELVLFFSFLAIMLARWILYPHVALRRALSDPDELGAYAIPPIALMTIGSLTAMQVSNGPWGGHAFTLVSYVCWWTGMFWVFITALVVLTTFFYTGNMVDRVFTPVLFMAPVGLATAGAEAGFIPVYSYEMSARLAVPMIVVGYFALGVAMFMAVLLYTISLIRLFASGWTVAGKRPGLFILIGPCGQLSTALMHLGEAASKTFAAYKPSFSTASFWTAETATGLRTAGLLFALLLLGFCYFWFCIALIGLADIIVKRQTTYTLTWWAIVFPVVTLATAWLELASEMDSPTFRALVCVLMVFLTGAYFVNLGFTVRGILNGSLIFGPTQAEIEDGIMKRVQEDEKRRDREGCV